MSAVECKISARAADEDPEIRNSRKGRPGRYKLDCLYGELTLRNIESGGFMAVPCNSARSLDNDLRWLSNGELSDIGRQQIFPPPPITPSV
jgi:hypothetical protein